MITTTELATRHGKKFDRRHKAALRQIMLSKGGVLCEQRELQTRDATQLAIFDAKLVALNANCTSLCHCQIDTGLGHEMESMVAGCSQCVKTVVAIVRIIS